VWLSWQVRTCISMLAVLQMRGHCGCNAASATWSAQMIAGSSSNEQGV
jgi:hypothetical protein